MFIDHLVISISFKSWRSVALVVNFVHIFVIATNELRVVTRCYEREKMTYLPVVFASSCRRWPSSALARQWASRETDCRRRLASRDRLRYQPPQYRGTLIKHLAEPSNKNVWFISIFFSIVFFYLGNLHIDVGEVRNKVYSILLYSILSSFVKFCFIVLTV